MIKYIFCDLDGTLLDMNQEEFTKKYFGALAKCMIPFGFDAESLVNGVKYGTKAMILNDGSQTNDVAFWNAFSKAMGKDMKEYLPIFDKFYQGDTSRKAEGNGLGLALVKRIIDVLGGEISVQSQVGKGSRFSINLEVE